MATRFSGWRSRNTQRQFHQYQQNEQSPLTSYHWAQKKTTTYDVGNPILVWNKYTNVGTIIWYIESQPFSLYNWSLTAIHNSPVCTTYVFTRLYSICIHQFVQHMYSPVYTTYVFTSLYNICIHQFVQTGEYICCRNWWIHMLYKLVNTYVVQTGEYIWVFLYVQWVEVRGDCSFCWFWRQLLFITV
jgi:hypothetical protein